jgi:hypothetical protein
MYSREKRDVPQPPIPQKYWGGEQPLLRRVSDVPLICPGPYGRASGTAEQEEKQREESMITRWNGFENQEPRRGKKAALPQQEERRELARLPHPRENIRK